ncbi:MAG: hypothetical protein AB7V46_23845 [Thermomicrobiales bacterium]
MRILVLAGLAGMLLTTLAMGQTPPRKIDASSALGAITGSSSTAALAGNLRALLLENFPDPLFEDTKNWGHKKRGLAGNWRNNGRWWKVRIAGKNVRDTLIVDLRDLQQPGKGVTTFRLFVSFDATIVFHRQTWKTGVRLYSGETRARCRVRLTLDCEALTKFVKGKNFLPDTIFRLRVVRSDLGYDNLVVEHTAGVGGDVAEILGDLLIGRLRQWKPSLERNLREKANAAIVKAADTKEVRVNLLDVLNGK